MVKTVEKNTEKNTPVFKGHKNGENVYKEKKW